MKRKIINEYLDYLKYEKHYSKNTINTYLNALNHLNDEIKKDILKLTSKDIESFISERFESRDFITVPLPTPDEPAITNNFFVLFIV